MGHFEKAVQFVLKHEGGHSHHPFDPAGETTFGIPHAKHRSIDKDDASSYYKKHFWHPLYDEVERFSYAAKVFDAAVHTGPHQAHLLIQRSLICLDFDIKDDGIFGKKTLECLNKTADFIPVFKGVLSSFYRFLTWKNPGLTCFLKGWLKRAYDVA